MSKLHNMFLAGVSAASILSAASYAFADTTYTVQSGDTLWGIARTYHTSVKELQAQNGLHSDLIDVGQILHIRSDASGVSTSSAAGGSTYRDYVVQPGDTLWQLASDADTSVQALKSINDLGSDTIRIGQHLRIPSRSGSDITQLASRGTGTSVFSTSSGKTYTVQQGNTLWGIAQQYGVSVSSLEDTNHLASDTIYPGEKLAVLAASTDASGSGASNQAADVTLYTVKAGDTLTGIGQTFGIPISTIKAVNDLNGDTIDTGQKLEIVSTQLADVPVNLIPVYKAAGAKYGIPWTVLAAIHKVESTYSVQPDIESPAGAVGPMQFMPAMFSAYGVSAPGNAGPPNIGNVDDAIYSAANFLAENGYASSPDKAIYAYNHSTQYVHTVLAYSEV